MYPYNADTIRSQIKTRKDKRKKKSKKIPAHWQHLSDQSRKLDGAPGEYCFCQGQWNFKKERTMPAGVQGCTQKLNFDTSYTSSNGCDCHYQDKMFWLNDYTYRQRFTPPPIRAVDRFNRWIVNENGILMGPHTYEEWLEYGFQTLDTFQDVIDGKKNADWSMNHANADVRLDL